LNTRDSHGSLVPLCTPQPKETAVLSVQMESACPEYLRTDCTRCKCRGKYQVRNGIIQFTAYCT